MRSRVLAVLVLVAAAGPAAAQDARLRDRLSPELAARVAALVDTARARGLPSEPLIQKALEGSSKGARRARIAAALSALLEALGDAKAALGGDALEPEIAVGALWLRGGGARDDLTRLKREAGDRSVAVPLTVLTDLVGRGVGRVEAVRSLDRMLGARLPDDEMLRLRDRVARAVLDGGSAVGALEREVDRLRAAPEPPR